MKESMARHIALLVFALLLGCAVCLAGCRNDISGTTTAPVSTDASTGPTESDNYATEPIDDGSWKGITADFFTDYVTEYSGTVDNEAFEGVIFQSNIAQPETYLTKQGVIAIWNYARTNGYDALRVHTYVKQYDNFFQIGNQTAINGQWNTVDIPMAQLDSLTIFKSHSSAETENYMWFEFIKMPTINPTSFIDGVIPYAGTIDEVTFDGFLFKSVEYQPMTHFTEDAVEDIKNYAEENGFNALRIHAYAIQLDNAFVVGGQYYGLSKWEYKDFQISEMTAENMTFWSQSQGITENYLYFEFVNSDNPIKPGKLPTSNKPSFVNTNPYFRSSAAFTASNYSGKVGDVEMNGIRIQSADYQPFIYFTDKAISKIKSAAEESGSNFLRIRSYAVLKNNGLVINNRWTAPDCWNVVEFPLDQLTTDFTFWSQSEGKTDIYLEFELFQMIIPEVQGPIQAESFTPAIKDDQNLFAVSFENFVGKIDGEIINGVKINSSDYQPYFKFTASAIAQIKAYAAESGNNFLNIHSYAILTDNCFVVGNEYTDSMKWTSTQIFVDALDEDYLFWSQSQGVTEIYLWFSWDHIDVPEKGIIDSSFFQPGYGYDGNLDTLQFTDYVGEVDGVAINGVNIKSSDYQPHFHFTEEGISRLQAYAAENDVNILTIHAYAVLLDNNLSINNQLWVSATWMALDVKIADLTTAFDFWSQSQGASDIYLTFGFYKADLINSASFIGSNLIFENYTGSIGGRDIKGIRVTSNSYQPSFYFTETSIKEIQTYAEANDFNTLRIHAYANVSNNDFVLNNQQWVIDSWKSLDVDIDSLTKDFKFFSASEGTTEAYLTFEFCKTEPINYSSFTGIGFAFEDYVGEIDSKSIVGVKATSNTYQPTFYFTTNAISRIQSYAEANNFNTLKINAYAILKDNALVINNQCLVVDEWSSLDVDIEELNSSFAFWSQSSGTTEIYLTFEFYKAELINKSSFDGADYLFNDYTGTIGGKEIVGIRATSDAYQPSFCFTESSIAKIKAYASANMLNKLRIHAYADVSNNAFVLNNQLWVVNEWQSLEIDVNALTTDFIFFSESEGTTEVYLCFELYKEEPINAASFSQGFVCEDFAGTVAERDVIGVKMISSSRQRCAFTAEAIEKIKEYARFGGYTQLKIQVYVSLDNNAFTVFGQSILQNQWNEITIPIDGLTTSSRIQTTCTGNTEAYFVFEFQ